MTKQVIQKDPFDTAPTREARRAPAARTRTVRVTIDLPAEIHSKARHKALDEHRSINAVGNELFADWAVGE